MEIWNKIVESNTFNFIIFLLIFVWICKKCKISSMIETMQKRVISLIEDAKQAKEKSIDELKNTQNFVANVENEVEEILSTAEQNAERLGQKILKDAEIQVSSILANTDKVVESEGQKIISSLSKKTTIASIEVAKKHIIDTLNERPHYHADFINDSIDELDRLKF